METSTIYDYTMKIYMYVLTFEKIFFKFKVNRNRCIQPDEMYKCKENW